MPLTRITSNVIENGTIIDADIAANAAISTSKLQSYSVSAKTIYLSPRTDGIAGTGTILDPYDASTPLKFVPPNPDARVETVLRSAWVVFDTSIQVPVLPVLCRTYNVPASKRIF